VKQPPIARDDRYPEDKPLPVRSGWEEAFKQMREAGDDHLEESRSTDWDDSEWVWE
jgi:hypothetical protein